MKKSRTSYNVRLYDNGDGTYSLGFCHRFKLTPKVKDIEGEWVDGSLNKVKSLLEKGSRRD